MGGIESFLGMGGYAAFVWPAYLLAAAVMGGFWAVSRAELKRRERQLQELEQRGGGRRRRRAEGPGGQVPR